MNPISSWPVFVLVVLAAIADLRWRRIPNWLTLPFLAGGLVANAVIWGAAGLGRSAAAVALACLILGGLCWLRAMGLGDLKLCAAAGAWIGPSALMFALVIAAMAGGVMAVSYALWKRKLGAALDNAASVLTQFPVRRSRMDPEALAIPYAPAIAAGVVFSFFTN